MKETKEQKEKTAEIEQFARRAGQKWYNTARQLDEVIRYMESVNLDCTAVYDAICAAQMQAEQNGHNNWADYKHAALMAAGEPPTLMNLK